MKAHGERAGVKLTFLPFIIKAVVAALKSTRSSTPWSTRPRRRWWCASTTTSALPSRPTPG
ncbi:MAG: hypothetical protein QM756_00025 [Polyangiaceae bacterium]